MTQVKVRLYDISFGMARIMSPALIGKQLDGIWHSSLEVFGLEYFFGGGICQMPPGTTPYGTPVQIFEMGTTIKTQREFETFLGSINHRFGLGTYHLLNHNCNNFTDEACHYLIGQGIPAHITGLPAEILATPLGRSFEPMINSMMQMQSNMFGEESAPSADGVISYADLFTEGNFTEIKTLTELTRFTTERSLVIFWEPASEEVYEALPALIQISETLKVGCVDLSRYRSLSTVKPPFARLYQATEVVNEQVGFANLLEWVAESEVLFEAHAS